MKGEVVPIVFITDNNYFLFTEVTLASVTEHISDTHNYHFFVLYKELEEKYLNTLNDYSRPGFHMSAVCIKSYVEPYHDVFYEKGHLKEAVYYRLMIPEIFKDYKTVIYMDSDIVLLEDIAGFIPDNMGDYILAAVRSERMSNRERQRRLNLGIAPDQYFFAGGIVINIPVWLRENIFEQCLTVLRNNPVGKFEYLEMDVLNIVCKNRVKYLSPRWNSVWYYDRIGKQMKSECPIEETALLHYASEIKPWDHPEFELSKYFWRYATMIPDYCDLAKYPLLATNKKLEEKNRQLRLLQKIISDLECDTFKNI